MGLGGRAIGLPGHQGHPNLHGIHQLLHFLQQSLVAPGGYPQLLSGKYHRSGLHLRHSLNSGLDFCCTVCAVQSVQKVHPGLKPIQRGDDLFFPARFLSGGGLLVIMTAPSAVSMVPANDIGMVMTVFLHGTFLLLPVDFST